MIVAVLASGPSMSQAVADSVRGRCKVVAVSDAWRLAPWADALASTDAYWWRHASPEFAGAKYAIGKAEGIERLEHLSTQTNSGLLGIIVAVEKLGATKVLVLGVDLHGTHFFGPHTGKLRNTSPSRMREFHHQFASYRPKGVEIYNCNPASKLKCYPMARLEDHLEGMAEPAAPDFRANGSIQGGAPAARIRRGARMHASPRRPGRDGQLESDPRSSRRGEGF